MKEVVVIKLYQENTPNWYYETKKKFDNGQTAIISFVNNNSYYDYKAKQTVWRMFVIYSIGSEKQIKKWMNARSSNIQNERTGRCGLQGVFWAMEQVKELIKLFSEEEKGNKLIIEVGWDDNKRRDMYYRGLSPLGFEYNNLYGYKALYYIKQL